MQTIIFTQKLLQQHRSLKSIIPLLALFVGLSASQPAIGQVTYSSDNITINASASGGTPVQTTYVANGSGAPMFEGANLGNAARFNQSTGYLALVASSATLNLGPNTTVTKSIVLYRVYADGATTLPSFSELSLDPISGDNSGANPAPSSIVFGVSNATINLLQQPAVTGPGTYTVEIKYHSEFTANGTPGSVDEPTSGSGHRATFTVLPLIAPPGGTTTWISRLDTDWLTADNWSNGVPTRFADAIIPDKAPTTPFTVTPLIGDPNATYEVRNLTLSGRSNSTRALLRVGQSVSGGSSIGATLQIYGDLNAYSGGLLAGVAGTIGSANSVTNSTLVLARNDGGDQVVRGAIDIVDIRVEGRGLKAVINEINASNTFTFNPDSNGPGVIVRTADDDATLTLNTTKTIKINLKDSGTIFGETNNSYIQGVTVADRPLAANAMESFGNIGVDITPNRPIFSNVTITRTVGNPLNPPPFPSNPMPIKRQYGITGVVNNNTTSTITFHYLDSIDELNGNPEQNLTIFKTINNGPPYAFVGRDIVDLVNNTITRVAYSGALNTLTLGDLDNPLPVTLISFDAKRINSDALITWQTASEVNSKGYEVQVSTDGKEFRALGAVPSAAPNSTHANSYSYEDKESGKLGTRYYRLRQIDLDGKEAFFKPVALSFDGKATAASSLAAYPNPFNSNDELHLAFQSSVTGKGQLRIADMTGRTVSRQIVELVNGLTDLSVANVKELNPGLYLVRFTMPTGEVKNLKIVKQ